MQKPPVAVAHLLVSMTNKHAGPYKAAPYGLRLEFVHLFFIVANLNRMVLFGHFKLISITRIGYSIVYHTPSKPHCILALLFKH